MATEMRVRGNGDESRISCFSAGRSGPMEMDRARQPASVSSSMPSPIFLSLGGAIALRYPLDRMPPLLQVLQH